MTVIIPPLKAGKVDVFVCDLISTHPDLPENLARKPRTVLLATRVTKRPHPGESKPVLRQAILSLPKLLVEGSPAEQQIVLGWLSDSCRLSVSLPDNRCSAWISDLEKIIKKRGSVKGDLDTLKGQLNHAARVIPLATHFLACIRAARHSRTNKKSWIKCAKPVLANLVLWMELLRRANVGISTCLIVTRADPTERVGPIRLHLGLAGFSCDQVRPGEHGTPREAQRSAEAP